MRDDLPESLDSYRGSDPDFTLSSAETVDVTAAFAAIYQDYGWGPYRAADLNGLLRRYFAAVTWVEEGRQMDIYAYSRQDDERLILAVLVERLAAPLNVRLNRVLAPWDARFEEVNQRHVLIDVGLTLEATEIAELTAVLTIIQQDRGFEAVHDGMRQLTWLVSRWFKVVMRIEQGYGLDTSNYGNDLDGRQKLAELASRLSAPLAARLNGVLAPWDTRFHTTTQDVTRCFCASRHKEDLGFWCYRAPLRFSADISSLELWLAGKAP